MAGKVTGILKGIVGSAIRAVDPTITSNGNASTLFDTSNDNIDPNVRGNSIVSRQAAESPVATKIALGNSNIIQFPTIFKSNLNLPNSAKLLTSETIIRAFNTLNKDTTRNFNSISLNLSKNVSTINKSVVQIQKQTNLLSTQINDLTIGQRNMSLSIELIQRDIKQLQTIPKKNEASNDNNQLSKKPANDNNVKDVLKTLEGLGLLAGGVTAEELIRRKLIGKGSIKASPKPVGERPSTTDLLKSDKSNPIEDLLKKQGKSAATVEERIASKVKPGLLGKPGISGGGTPYLAYEAMKGMKNDTNNEWRNWWIDQAVKLGFDRKNFYQKGENTKRVWAFGHESPDPQEDSLSSSTKINNKLSDTDINILSKLDINIKSSQDINLEAKQDITIKGRNIILDGNVQIKGIQQQQQTSSTPTKPQFESVGQPQNRYNYNQPYNSNVDTIKPSENTILGKIRSYLDPGGILAGKGAGVDQTIKQSTPLFRKNIASPTFGSKNMMPDIDYKGADKGSYNSLNARANFMQPDKFGPPGSNIVSITTAGGHKFRVNAASADAFKRTVEDLEAAGMPLGTIGGYSARPGGIAGTGIMSQHAMGNAMDIGSQSARDVITPAARRWIDEHPHQWRQILDKNGMISGGDWKNPDLGHIEWSGRKPWEEQKQIQQAASLTSTSYTIDKAKTIATLRAHEPRLQGIGSLATDDMIWNGFTDHINKQGITVGKDGKLIGDSKTIEDTISGIKNNYPKANIDDVITKTQTSNNTTDPLRIKPSATESPNSVVRLSNNKNDVHAAIENAANKYGLDPAAMKAYAKIESDFQPDSNRHRATQYKGLFQLGANEFKQYGKGDIYNANDNAMAAAAYMADNKAKFAKIYGREPTDTEIYMMHQQGLGFYTKGAMTNIAGNPYKGMKGSQSHESFEQGWGNEINLYKARYEDSTSQQSNIVQASDRSGNVDPQRWGVDSLLKPNEKNIADQLTSVKSIFATTRENAGPASFDDRFGFKPQSFADKAVNYGKAIWNGADDYTKKSAVADYVPTTDNQPQKISTDLSTSNLVGRLRDAGDTPQVFDMPGKENAGGWKDLTPVDDSDTWSKVPLPNSDSKQQGATISHTNTGVGGDTKPGSYRNSAHAPGFESAPPSGGSSGYDSGNNDVDRTGICSI